MEESQPNTSAGNAWTLESELLRLSGKPTTSEALASLGIVPSNGCDFQIVPSTEGWFRSGAETYLYKFSIRTEQIERELVLKACVAFGIGTTVSRILASWMKRRAALVAAGIQSPFLYGWGNGVILEEFVPFTVRQVLTERPNSREAVLCSLARLSGTLSAMGFEPLQIHTDLRSRGSDSVLIDFGQDLGDATDQQRRLSGLVDDRLLRELLAVLDGWGIKISPQLKRNLEDIYFSRFRRS